jgi:precorrin-2 dehydrogenase/sirohydrochlorin ferrochelatase
MPSPYYFAALNLEIRLCVIVGGGEVAERKIDPLLESGADIAVVSPEPCAAIQKRTEEFEITLFRRPYQFGDLEGAWLAIAATDSREINHLVYEEATKRRILVNVADSLQECNYVVPAVLDRGDVRIAVTSGGRSPILAQKARDEIAKVIGPEYADLARILGACRREVRELLPNPQDRQRLWTRIVNTNVLTLASEGRSEEIRERVFAYARRLAAGVKTANGETLPSEVP